MLSETSTLGTEMEGNKNIHLTNLITALEEGKALSATGIIEDKDTPLPEGWEDNEKVMDAAKQGLSKIMQAEGMDTPERIQKIEDMIHLGVLANDWAEDKDIQTAGIACVCNILKEAWTDEVPTYLEKLKDAYVLSDNWIENETVQATMVTSVLDSIHQGDGETTKKKMDLDIIKADQVPTDRFHEAYGTGFRHIVENTNGRNMNEQKKFNRHLKTMGFPTDTGWGSATATS